MVSSSFMIWSLTRCRHNLRDQNRHDVRAWVYPAKLRLQETKRKDSVLEVESEGMPPNLKKPSGI